MANSYLRRMRRGAGSVLNGISSVYRDQNVRKTYRFILLGFFALSLVLNLSGGYLVWYFSEPANDAPMWMTWGLYVLRILGWLAVLLVSPLVAITTCNIFFPVFSEIPFFAGLRSFNAPRAATLQARTGLGTAAAIGTSLRRFSLFLAVSAGCFLLGLIPGVGPLVAPPLQFYFAVRTVSWEMMDPYFDRLGLAFGDQKAVLRKYSAEFIGMGLVCGPLLAIPLLGPLLFGLVQAGSAKFVIDVFPPGDSAEDLLTWGS